MNCHTGQFTLFCIYLSNKWKYTIFFVFISDTLYKKVKFEIFPQDLAHISADGLREQTVAEHLLGTAELAAGFGTAFGAEEEARLAGLLHDIGKCSDAFQARLRGGDHCDHSTAGAQEATTAACPTAARRATPPTLPP